MSEFKQMTLSQCATFDHQSKLKDKLTGWGKISKSRTGKGISRKDRIKAKKESK